MILSLTPLEPQSPFGDKPVKFQVVCPRNVTAVLKGLRQLLVPVIFSFVGVFLSDQAEAHAARCRTARTLL